MQFEKRQISILLPYILEQGTVKVFLQKRSPDQKTLPNYFGFWGGGAENNETPEFSLQREMKAELNMDIKFNEVTFFNRYEFLKSIKFIFLFQPPLNWEDTITIGEGEYGKWFSAQEALDLTDFIFEDKVVINDLERALLKKPIR